MDKKEEIIDRFNEVLSSFLNELKPFIGDSYIKKFKLVTSLSKKQPLKSFIQYVMPLQQKIVDRDETYFTDYDMSKDGNAISEFLHLNGLYNTLDGESKNNVWMYLSLLLAIAIEYLHNKNKKN
jgi:hypothetical protein